MEQKSLAACVVAFAVAACAVGESTAVAQSGSVGWIMEVTGGPVSPSNPSVQVRMTAFFDERVDVAFALSRWGVHAGDGAWRDPLNVFESWTQHHPILLGDPLGHSIINMRMGQIHFPPSVIGNLANPIRVWEATWFTDATRRAWCPLTATRASSLFTSKNRVRPSA